MRVLLEDIYTSRGIRPDEESARKQMAWICSFQLRGFVSSVDFILYGAQCLACTSCGLMRASGRDGDKIRGSTPFTLWFLTSAIIRPAPDKLLNIFSSIATHAQPRYDCLHVPRLFFFATLRNFRATPAADIPLLSGIDQIS